MFRYAAVAANEHTFLKVYTEGKRVHMAIDGDIVFDQWFVDCPEELLFIQCAILDDGNIMAIGKGHDTGNAYIVTEDGYRDIAPTEGNNPVGIMRGDNGFHISVLTSVKDAGHYQNFFVYPNMVVVPGPMVDIVPSWWTPPATGMLQLDEIGHPVWVVTNTYITLSGELCRNPQTDGTYTCAVPQNDNQVVAYDGQSLFTVTDAIVSIHPVVASTSVDAVVAVSGYDGDFGFYHKADWKPFAHDPPQPVVVPEIKPLPYAAFLGPFPTTNTPGYMANQNCMVKDGAVVDEQGNTVLHLVDVEFATNNGMTIEGAIKSVPEPRLVYWGGRFTDNPPPSSFWNSLGAVDIVACPLYRGLNEDINSFFLNGVNQVTVAANHNREMIVIANVTTRGFLSEQEVLDCGPVYRQLLDVHACIGLLFFGINRGSQLNPPWFLPSFQTLVDRFTVNGLPVIVVPQPPDPPIEPEVPMIPDITGPELEAYLDRRAEEVFRAFSAKLHKDLVPNGAGISLPDARAQAKNAVNYIHQACDKLSKPWRIALPEEILTITRIYYGQRDTLETQHAIEAYCVDQVRLRG